MILNTTNLQEIRNQIQKIKKTESKVTSGGGRGSEALAGGARSEPIIVKAEDEEFNRKVLEIKGVNILLSPELHRAKDKLKQRDSGLNEFLAKLAAKNNISIAIDIESLSSLLPYQKAKTLARIKQNIMLCKKAKCKIILFPENKYSKLDAIAFLTTLGASTEQEK